MEHDLKLPIDGALLPMIDGLVDRWMPVADVVAIVGTSAEVVLEHLDYRKASRQREQKILMQGAERCVELRWHETLELLVQSPARASLLVELVEGGGELDVGNLEPIQCRT